MHLELNWTLHVGFGKLIETLHDYVWPGDEDEDDE